ncbi:hypothetical protein Sjap_014908 [Stephania japonica]|uniref:FBD domain-containing protein n=1 Tax=Stephania japonica TaxID=461633 RepID=A0AAP0NTH2_9MAGN
MAAFTTVNAPFKLPNALFNCQTLTSLRLSLNENTSFPVYLPLHWPSSISLPNLKVLRLFRVSFRDLYAASKFILSCPSLLTLELLHCSFDGRGCFCIGSPSLKFLTIQTPVHLTSPDDSFVIIGVLAPNLKYLLFDADMRMGFLFVRARTHLERAAINMELFKGTRSLLPLVDLPFTDKLKKVLVRYVTNIIGAVHLTEDLTLSPWTLQNKSTATHVGDWWNSELSNECMLHHLKDVEISGIVGCLAEVKLLQVVLKRATILQRMVLRTSAESTVENKLLKGLSKMLLELPRASSNVALLKSTAPQIHSSIGDAQTVSSFSELALRRRMTWKKINGDGDRLSNLPESLLHHILFFLDAKYALAFGPHIAQRGISLQFPNLKHLKLQTRFSRDCALSIMQLLKTSPQMETLKIEIVEPTLMYTLKEILRCPIFSKEKDCSACNKYSILEAVRSTKDLTLNPMTLLNGLPSMHIGGWWQSELSNQFMFHHLKDVKISGIVGCLTEVKLVEVVLTKATILRGIVLCTSAESLIEKKWLIGLSRM